jgi:hypothetical protein
MTDDPKEQPYCPVMTTRLLERRIRQGIYRFADGELEKRCGMCHDFWPADTLFFGLTGDSLKSYCRACDTAHTQLRRHAGRDQPPSVDWPVWPVPGAV